MPTTSVPHHFDADALTGLLAVGAPPRFIRTLLTEYVDRDHWLASPLRPGEDPTWRSARPISTPDWQTLVWNTPAYPPPLARLSSPPPVCYVRGNPSAIADGVAIIGSRACTEMGRIVATLAADTAVELRAPVISGLAIGVDTIAHEVALARNGVSVAFLGAALDMLSNEQMRRADAIVDSGGAVCSELPPGTETAARHLYARNRLIAACATPLVVAEAALNSGSSACAVEALVQGRPVVVPRPRPGHRRQPGAAGLLALAAPPAKAATLLDIPHNTLARFPSTAPHLANAVCDTREELMAAVKIFVWLHR